MRVNASPYVMAGVNAAQVKNLNHHWVVDGSWPTDGKVLVGRDIADAIVASIPPVHRATRIDPAVVLREE